MSGDTPIGMFRRSLATGVKVLLVSRSFDTSPETVTQFTRWIIEHNVDYLAPLRFEYDWQVHIDDSVPDHIVAEVYLKRK